MEMENRSHQPPPSGAQFPVGGFESAKQLKLISVLYKETAARKKAKCQLQVPISFPLYTDALLRKIKFTWRSKWWYIEFISIDWKVVRSCIHSDVLKVSSSFFSLNIRCHWKTFNHNSVDWVLFAHFYFRWNCMGDRFCIVACLKLIASTVVEQITRSERPRGSGKKIKLVSPW